MGTGKSTTPTGLSGGVKGRGEEGQQGGGAWRGITLGEMPDAEVLGVNESITQAVSIAPNR